MCLFSFFFLSPPFHAIAGRGYLLWYLIRSCQADLIDIRNTPYKYKDIRDRYKEYLFQYCFQWLCTLSLLSLEQNSMTVSKNFSSCCLCCCMTHTCFTSDTLGRIPAAFVSAQACDIHPRLYILYSDFSVSFLHTLSPESYSEPSFSCMWTLIFLPDNAHCFWFSVCSSVHMLLKTELIMLLFWLKSMQCTVICDKFETS